MVYLFCEKLNETPQQDFAECISLLFDNSVQVEAAEKTNEEEEASDDQAQEVKKKPAEPLKTADPRPRVLFSYNYSHLDSNSLLENNLEKTSVPANLSIVGGSRAEIDFDSHVSEAEMIFRSICPTDEFMPRPPDPEDIIFDSDEKKDEEPEAKKSELTVEPDQVQIVEEESKEENEIAEKMSLNENPDTS